MSLDYAALLYDPIYLEIGVPATFIAGEIEASITVIDDTRPKVITDWSMGSRGNSSTDVRGMGPGAFARIPELVAAGITQNDWIDAALNFNGRNWTVRSYELRGSPAGEDQGEVRFLLKTGNG
jgi:hypothetical protein